MERAMNVNSSIVENLKSMIDKKAYVTLESGKTFIGTIEEVGEDLVKLVKIDNKEFHDALIRIDNITAIHSRIRQFKS
jgi:small nuclear ribonucleoprotein (snRNP)-like protein